jgi:hypothetical protein
LNFTTWLAATSIVQMLSCGSMRRADRGIESVGHPGPIRDERCRCDRTGTAAIRRARTCGCRRPSHKDDPCACRRRSRPSNSRRRRHFADVDILRGLQQIDEEKLRSWDCATSDRQRRGTPQPHWQR